MKIYFVVLLLFFGCNSLFAQVLVGAPAWEIKEVMESKGLFKLSKTIKESNEYGSFTILIFIPIDKTPNVSREYRISDNNGLCTLYKTTQPIRFLAPFKDGMKSAGWSRVNQYHWVSPDESLEVFVTESKTSFSAIYIKNIVAKWDKEQKERMNMIRDF